MKESDGFISYRFSGNGAKKAFANEAGGHRWQGESKGRTHSSTVTVAVLPEPKKTDLKIPPRDLKFETYRDTGPGGQNKNKNDTAVRVTHIPTGVQACSTMKSQARNKELALSTLRARLASRQQAESSQSRNSSRRKQVGNGSRAGHRVRTIKLQQNIVIDHRSGNRINYRQFKKGIFVAS